MSEFETILRQLKMRLPGLDNLAIEPGRKAQAAVSLILRDGDGLAQILIIERAKNPQDHWSGHLALPGGRAASRDVDLIATAVRETREEVGIDLLSGGAFIGQLGKLAPNHPRLPLIEITPLVALAPPHHSLRLNREVEAAFWLSIRQLKEQGRSTVFKYQIDGCQFQWPAYWSERGPIWGITERILTDFLRLLD
jgi:8-oxo-dGTP pyrophosphatase MutT (NUDIX family)